MAKYFIDVLQDTPRTRLQYLLKPKSLSLEPINRPRNQLSALNFTGDWFRLIVAYGSFVICSPGASPQSLTH